MAMAIAWLPPVAADGSPGRILVDGDFADWHGHLPVHDDPRGDGDGVDFGRLWITHDEHYLHLRLEVGAELSLQQGNQVELHLDLDGDPRTGWRVHGIGADLQWVFGKRSGILSLAKRPRQVDSGELGLISAPTVTADAFEIALARDAGASTPLFDHPRLRLVLTSGPGGDVLPDGADGVAYSLTGEPPPPVEPIPLAKRDASDLRVVTYNTNDHLFERRREGAYRRILKAVGPDVVLLQEVRSNTSEQVTAHLAPTLATPSGGWHHAQTGAEATVLLSPFPIERVEPLGDSGAFLLDARPVHGTRLLLVALSMPCCNQDRERREEIERIMDFLDDAKTPGGRIDVEAGTPLLLIGDANLVGFAEQRRTLLEGLPDRAPDWDGTPFTDLVPRHTHRNVTFTWAGRRFWPGRLDYVIYSDSVAGVGNRFVLYTPDMPAAALAAHGLERDDTRVATDHLPVVADFVFTAGSN